MPVAHARSPIGLQLRLWRNRRGWSQGHLAQEAGTTARHLSFVETGRSRPGADLVRRLAHAMDLPLRERNALYVAAGLPPAYPAHDLSDLELAPVRRVVDQMLARHEPYPAWLVGRGMKFLACNQAADALFPGLCAMSQEAVVDMFFGPGAFRERVENWREVTLSGIDMLRREVVRYTDPGLSALLRRAQALTKDLGETPADCPAGAPVVCPRFNIDGHVVRTITTVVRFDTAVELTASELRLELMFPADDSSERFFRQWAQGHPQAA